MWLGFEINTENMSVCIEPSKLSEIRAECRVWKSKATATKKEIQRMAGKLQHVTKCVKSARKFMNRVLSALRHFPLYGAHQFPRDLLADLDWFTQFASNSHLILPSKPRTEWVIECDSTQVAGAAF